MAEDLKKKAAEEKVARDRVQAAQRERATGKPTPTQEELDAHNLGAPVTEHEPDGSAVEVQLTAVLPEDIEKVQKMQREKSTGKPTPTQKELNAANTNPGAEAVKLEPDGSTAEGEVTKQIEAQRPTGGYQTRAAQPRRPTPPAE